MKRLAVMMIISAMVFIAGCNKTENIVEPDVETNVNKPTIILKDEEVVEEKVVYGVGERVQVREDYAVTLVGVTELEDEEYSNGIQTLLVDFMFENISIDEDHEVHKLEHSQSNGLGLSMSDGNTSIPYSILPYYWQVVNHTPVRSKSLQRYVYTKETVDDLIDLRFEDYLGDSTNFQVNVGDEAPASFEGEMPKYLKTYKIGEPMILIHAEKDYTLTVDSVRKIDMRPEELMIDAEVLYEVLMSYSVPDKDKFSFGVSDLVVIDEMGNTGYTTYMKKEGYPLELEDGFQVPMYVATHIDSDKLILYYTQDYQVEKEGYFIEIDVID